MNLNFFAPCNSLGYGNASRNILKQLHLLGLNISFHPIGQLECPDSEVKIVGDCLKNSVNYDNNATCLKIWHAKGLKEMIGRGKKVGFPIFELDKFTDIEKHQINSLDELVVCSDWAKEVCKNNGVTVPTHIVPLGVDRNIFNDFLYPENDIIKDSATKFFICGKWELRKGHDAVIEAFCKAFKPQDNVRLICNCYNPFIGKEGNNQWNQMYLLSNMGSKIHIITERIPTQIGVAELMASVDCGVFVSRAEGWNLELLEMMACGKSVIATNATAHKQFANKENCYLVETGELETAYDGVFFNGFGNWPSITENSIDQIVEHMRDVHNKKQSGQLAVNAAGIETATKFSWENSANLLSRIL